MGTGFAKFEFCVNNGTIELVASMREVVTNVSKLHGNIHFMFVKKIDNVSVDYLSEVNRQNSEKVM